MSYFPFFIDIKDKRCVIVGGGKVALRKVEKLIPFEPKIIVIAPEICREIRNCADVKSISRSFCEDDLDGAFMAIGATDDEEINARVYELCMKKKILVNTVDDREKCGFIFPALVNKNNITVGISTSGSSPVYAKYLKEQIENNLGARQLEIAGIMSRYRSVIRLKFADEDMRRDAAEKLLKFCTECERLPDEEQINFLLEAIEKSYEG